MNKNSSGMRIERRTETIDITKIEIGRPSDVIDVGGKGEGAVEDDTQTLDLRGGRDGRVTNGNIKVMEFV